jgi:serine/threonine protein kinase
VTEPPRPFRLSGTELAGYRVHSLIGQGGMAQVYRADDRRLSRTVALKVLAPELGSNPDFRHRFLRESQVAASIDHPNIIAIYDAGEADRMLYIAMPYVKGTDLKAMLAGGRQLDIPYLVDILSQVADALDAAHANGLVHRDVEPANILISPAMVPHGHDHVYLTDFGITKRAVSLSGVTAPGAITGTLDYIAPEQIVGKPVSAQTDQYSLGCIVYQCLTGHVPFVHKVDASALWAHQFEALPPISQRRSDLPSRVQTVIAKATAKNAVERYRNCREFIAALAAELHAGGALVDARAGDPVPKYQPTDLGVWPAPPVSPPPVSGPPVSTPAGLATPEYARQRDGQSREAPASNQVRSPVGAALRGLRKWPILGVVGLLALLCAFYGFRLASGTSSSRFAGDDLVPISFDHPASWQKAGAGTNVVFSPHAEEILPLFAGRGETRGWSQTGRLLHDDRAGTIGLYTFFVSTQYSSASTNYQQQILRSLLPETVAFTDAPSHLKLGAFDATRLSGVFSDPSTPATRLRFECYITQIDLAGPRTVNLIFFSSDDSFDNNRETFDQIAASVGTRR